MSSRFAETPLGMPLLRRVLASISYRLPRLFDRYVRSIGTGAALRRFDRYNLGSGRHPLAGWANLDLEGRENLIWDLRWPLPRGTRARFVFSEHFIEHVTIEDARKLLQNVRAVMAGGGVIRISTPDLAEIVRCYDRNEVRQAPEADFTPVNRCQLVNQAMRLWGHLYIYDEEEMRRLLSECGFRDIRRVRHHESEHRELRNLETRPDQDDLIVEATAP